MESDTWHLNETSCDIEDTKTTSQGAGQVSNYYDLISSPTKSDSNSSLVNSVETQVEGNKEVLEICHLNPRTQSVRSNPEPPFVGKFSDPLKASLVHEAVKEKFPGTCDTNAFPGNTVQTHGGVMGNLMPSSQELKHSVDVPASDSALVSAPAQVQCQMPTQGSNSPKGVVPVGLFLNIVHVGNLFKYEQHSKPEPRLTSGENQRRDIPGDIGEAKPKLSGEAILHEEDRVDEKHQRYTNNPGYDPVNDPVSNSVSDPAYDLASDTLSSRPGTDVPGVSTSHHHDIFRENPDASNITHASQKRHTCNICNKAFKQATNLQSHIRTHTGEKPYTCNTCSRSFSQIANLRTHERTHTGEKLHTCNTCGKSFSLICNLQRHERIHTGEKPYACTICGKKFAQAYHLRAHVRTHTEEKPYTCSTCGKAFARSNYCKNHERTHTEERPYKCKLCDKAFKHISTLSEHKRTHVGEPFRCKFCSIVFSQVHRLQRHERTHTDCKSYTCGVCGRAYLRSTDLELHKRGHTGKTPAKCDICNRTFSHSGSLKLHQRSHSI